MKRAKTAKLGSVRRVFPPKGQKQKRKKGVVKDQMAFRPPADLRAYIEAAEDGGYTKTEILIRMLGMAKDAVEALGPEWFEIERLAATERTTPGLMLARLAQDALKKTNQKR